METGRIMQKKRITIWRRYKKVFSGGRIEHTDWEVSADIEVDEIVSTFGDSKDQGTIGFDTVKTGFGLLGKFNPLNAFK